MNSHDELTALAAGYVLEALDPEDRGAFEEHLATCGDCAQQVAEMRTIVHLLPFAVEERSPSPELKERILATFRAEAVATHRARDEKKPFFSRLQLLLTPRLGVALTIVLLAFTVAGLAVWNTRLQNNVQRRETNVTKTYQAINILGQAEKRWLFNGKEEAPNATGTLAHSKKQSAWCLVLWNLPPEDGKFFQVWTFSNGYIRKIGTLWPMATGKWIIIPNGIEELNSVVVTMESTKDTSLPGDKEMVRVNLKSRE